MNNLKKNDEILMTEEEPVPEEYKEQKLSINSNALKQDNNKILSGANKVFTSKPNINNINNINNISTNKKLHTENNQNKNNNITNNNSITLSRVSKAKTSFFKRIFEYSFRQIRKFFKADEIRHLQTTNERV